jgi:hypothetical protein
MTEGMGAKSLLISKIDFAAYKIMGTMNLITCPTFY